MFAPGAGVVLDNLPVETYPVPVVSAWSVVFMSGPRRSFWDWFTCSDYRHVACYGWANGYWVVIDPADSRMFVTALDQSGLEQWLAARSPRITAIVKVSGGERFPKRFRVGMWCTSVVSYALALGVGAFTPKGLKRVLLRNGAVEL
jgi:hypothetical protein